MVVRYVMRCNSLPFFYFSTSAMKMGYHFLTLLSVVFIFHEYLLTFC
nr:MAG TPA: hypothetical protein [Caudoviricetes sp.]